jgi:hypothetical protein
MIKIYFNDGSKKKVNIATFIQWMSQNNLQVENNKLYHNGIYIAYYLYLSNDTFCILDCILSIILTLLIILLIVKGGVIL